MSDSQTPRPDDPERDRGILTQADRKFLLGSKELKAQSEREARQRIRERLKNGLLDLSLLRNRLREDDRTMVAESMSLDKDLGDFSLISIVGFIYQLILATSPNIKDTLSRFEDVAEIAIESVTKQAKDNNLLDVTVSIEVDRLEPDTDVLLSKYDNNEETLDELFFLRNQGLIDTNERYSDHLYNRLWEEGHSITVPSENGPEMINPDDYDSQEEFREASAEALREARDRNSEEGM